MAIEDSGVGVESAASAGIDVVAIPNEYTIGQDLSKATYGVQSLVDILGLF